MTIKMVNLRILNIMHEIILILKSVATAIAMINKSFFLKYANKYSTQMIVGLLNTNFQS